MLEAGILQKIHPEERKRQEVRGASDVPGVQHECWRLGGHMWLCLSPRAGLGPEQSWAQQSWAQPQVQQLWGWAALAGITRVPWQGSGQLLQVQEGRTSQW